MHDHSFHSLLGEVPEDYLQSVDFEESLEKVIRLKPGVSNTLSWVYYIRPRGLPTIPRYSINAI